MILITYWEAGSSIMIARLCALATSAISTISGTPWATCGGICIIIDGERLILLIGLMGLASRSQMPPLDVKVTSTTNVQYIKYMLRLLCSQAQDFL